MFKKFMANHDYPAIFTTLICFVPVLNYYMNFIIQAYDRPSISAPVYMLLYLVIMISYLYAILRDKLVFTLLLIVALVYAYTLLLWPQNKDFMFGHIADAVYNPLYRIIFLGLPLVFLPSLIRNYKGALYWMNIISRIIIIIAFYAYFVIIIGEEHHFEYMTFSYNLLLPVCISFVYAIKNRQRIWTVISIVGMLCVFAIGSRGAMLSMGLFLLIYFLFGTGVRLTRKKLILILILSVLIVLFVFNIGIFAEFLYDWFKALGFESRSLEKLAQGTLFEDSGRDKIFKAVKEAISEAPYLGNGIFGDIYANKMYLGNATYAHNIILEILCHYGFFMGGAILIAYFYYSLKTLLNKNVDENIYLIYICVFSSMFLKMFVTGTYLSNPDFALLIGFILCIEKKQRRAVK